MHVVETAGAVGRKGHDMPLAERVVQWQCHIVGQALRPHVAKDGVLAAKQGIAFEILADLGGAFMDLIGGTVDVFGSAPDIVVDPFYHSLTHPIPPHHSATKPLRMVDHYIKRPPPYGKARSRRPATHVS